MLVNFNNRVVKVYCNIFILIVLVGFISCSNSELQKKPPNVILILTDDQGIGDLGCHGNPWLKTPNIDNFYSEAVRLTDFHVSPLCTVSH